VLDDVGFDRAAIVAEDASGAGAIHFLVTFGATGRVVRSAAEILAGAMDIGPDLRAGVHTLGR
jgi:hypothetical protein